MHGSEDPEVAEADATQRRLQVDINDRQLALLAQTVKALAYAVALLIGGQTAVLTMYVGDRVNEWQVIRVLLIVGLSAYVYALWQLRGVLRSRGPYAPFALATLGNALRGVQRDDPPDGPTNWKAPSVIYRLTPQRFRDLVRRRA